MNMIDATPTPAPAKKRKRWPWVLGIMLAVLVAISVASAGSGSHVAATKGTDSHPAREDVVLTSCASPDAIGSVYAKGNVTNHSSKRSDYVVELTLTNGSGAQLGSGLATVENVEPGQVAHWEGLAATSIDTSTGNTCHVVDVTRTASF